MQYRARISARVSVAPMMDKTDRHFRHFIRILSKSTLLYTEMINPEAIIHGDRERLLGRSDDEHPVALQLGSDNPEHLARAISLAKDWQYDEFNLNVGCPSDRVQFRNIGACLMADPARVAACVTAMRGATDKPVTVKHRVGIRGHGISKESYEDLCTFVQTVREAGCDGVSVHARIAILEGLSPKENRSVPPLRYGDVYQLKKDFPDLPLEINGHVRSWKEAAEHLAQGMDSVMIGRASYEDSWLFSQADAFTTWSDQVFGPSYAGLNGDPRPQRQYKPEVFDSTSMVLAAPALSRFGVCREFGRYINHAQASWDLNPRSLVWPLLELFNGMKGSRKFRQTLSEPIKPGTDMLALVEKALSYLSPC